MYGNKTRKSPTTSACYAHQQNSDKNNGIKPHVQQQKALFQDVLVRTQRINANSTEPRNGGFFD